MLTVKMNGIRETLSPILFISYVLGTRIIEFPTGEPRLWCSFLYILLVWSIYNFLMWYTTMHYLTAKGIDSIDTYKFFFWLNVLIALLSIFLGICHDKKFRTCLRKLNIVDNTLEKIGMITDHQKLYTKILLIVFGWIAYIICITCGSMLWFRDEYGALFSIYICFMLNYPFNVNVLNDLLVTSILKYVELKFEQINEYLRKLDRDNAHKIKRAWEHSVLVLCQSVHPKSSRSEYTAWIVIHLHLELRKISRELNSIFGLQMTINMGIDFAFIALACRQLFHILFTINYHQKKTMFMILNIIFLVLHIFRLFIINYIYERVSVKAKMTGDIISRIPHSNFDVMIRENISQFLLYMNLTPLKFYGLGLFKFGLKFFYGFSSSVSTVIVILIQSYTAK